MQPHILMVLKFTVIEGYTICFFFLCFQDLSTGPSDEPLLSQLCDNFLPSLINSSQILVYTTTTECDPRHGYTTARRKAYVELLCQQVHYDLVMLTKRANISETREDGQVCDALARERAEQEDVCAILSRFYDVVRPEEEKVSCLKRILCFTV